MCTIVRHGSKYEIVKGFVVYVVRSNFCCLQFEITFFPVLVYFKHV